MLLSVVCLGVAMMFVGGWYFQTLVEVQKQECQSSFINLTVQQQETVEVVQQLKETVRKQSKKLSELYSQLDMKQVKVNMHLL